MQVQLARARSFTTPAMLTLLMYIVLWLPGLIANLLYYREAKATEQIAGQSLPGVGCLGWMLILNLGALGLVAVILVITRPF
ncbi:MAG: hypothetical protein AB7R89_28755 [Dehalococcoidia bacterium]